MPSLEHETLVELFSRDPHTAVSMLAATNRARIPPHDHVEVRPADERELTPTSLRVDVVVLLRRGEPVLVLLLEVQLSRDDDKLFTWPFYVTSMRLRYRCPAVLMVYAPGDEVARWCQKAIDLGQPDSPFLPLVVGPRQVPRIETPGLAVKMPYAALLSAVAHGQAPDNEKVFEALWAALENFGEDDRRVWVELLLATVNETAKKILEAKMNLDAIKEQLPFFIEGKLKGKAEGKAEGLAAGKAEGKAEGLAAGKAQAIEAVLGARGLVVPASVSEALRSCEDQEQLDAWVRAAVTVASAEALLGVLPPGPGTQR